jgi:coenzyme F420 biosynthesis associated uncharacterized protein
MEAARVDWSMGAKATLLIDWGTASDIGRAIAGPGPAVAPVDRAKLREDVAEVVPHAEELISEFTGMKVAGFRSRAWVMSRGDWIDANLAGLQRLLEPLAQRVLARNPSRSGLRRKALGAQIGVLLGYVSRKVLGQYDVFLPPDDDGLLYFVGPNLADVERRFHLPGHDFRLWVALHEVTHRVQFGATEWLRGYLSRLIDAYLDSVQLETRELIAQLRRAIDEVRDGGIDWRGPHALLLLMSPQQRDLFHQMQSLMSLLEGHASYTMNVVAAGRVRDVERMRRVLKERRQTSGSERTFQRAIGFDTKIAQYEVGERFVRTCVDRAGMDAFNRVWTDEEHLPTIEEIAEPDRWLARVGRA